jgi:hypothetical protein
MHRVLAIIHEAKARVAAHGFFDWLRLAPVPLADKFAFSPVLADFIMGFADMNKWFVSYEDPTDALEHTLNDHAKEDQTHSRLFVDEWTKLGLDQRLGFGASQTLWWWFWCSETEVVRRAAMETLGLTERAADPLVRFAMIEAIETCGDVFFSNTCPIAVALEQQTGVTFDYYGIYHREREDGHLRCDERSFVQADLDPQQYARAVHAATRIFELFEQELDQLLDYAQRVCRDPRAVARTVELERRAQLQRTGAHDDASAARSPDAPVPEEPATPVSQRLRVRIARLRQHRLIRWLSSPAASDGHTAVEALRALTPLWAIDVLGYKDFNRYVLAFEAPRDAEQRAINRWTERLASHGILYLRDWEELGLDHVLGWSARDTIEHYFLGERSEVHRHAMALVKKRAFVSDSARLRYWLMRALEDGGQVLFDALGPMVAAAQGTLGAALSYWAGQHHVTHPVQPTDPEADALSLATLPLDEDEQRSALHTLDLVFDNFERLFDLSMSVVSDQLGTVRANHSPASSSRPIPVEERSL